MFTFLKNFNNYLNDVYISNVDCNNIEYNPKIVTKKDYEKCESKYIKIKKYNKDNTYSKLSFKKKEKNKNALIWIHGFNDVYYQYNHGEYFLEKGYDIYAITLRRYYNNYYKFYSNNLDEFIEDIDNNIKYVLANNYNNIVLYGHSFGGLLSVLYFKKGLYRSLINKLILNSPFFDFFESKLMKFLLNYPIYYLGYLFPKLKLTENKKLCDPYAMDILNRYYFNDEVKNINYSDKYAGFIYTLVDNFKLIHNKEININIPILVLCSDKSYKNSKIYKHDSVLDVEDIKKYSNYIGSNVKIEIIEDAIHDVLVSDKHITDKAMAKIFNFLNK